MSSQLVVVLKESISVVPTGKYIFQHKGYPLSIEEQAKDLAEVVAQYQKRKISDKLQKTCDESFNKLFQIYLESKGRTYNTDYYDMMIVGLKPIIIKLKEYYDRPRPATLAKSMGVDFLGDELESAQSPSYPSGHAIQSYVMANMLSDQFPEHEENLLKIAEIISQSRIDRGVHFPTDIEYGKEVAESLFLQIKEGLGGDTPQDKQVYDQIV